MRVGALLLALALCGLPPLVTADHQQPPEGGGGQGLSFDHRGGNEWWVEVALGGFFAPDAKQVSSRDDGGAWVPLTLRSWGNYAGSYHIEPGHRVQFRAVWPAADGSEYKAWTSCWFTHPGGLEQCATAPTPAGLLASTYVGPTPGALERVFDVAVDGQGNAFVTGSRYTEYANHATADAFVRQVLPNGQTGWTTWLGGSNFDEGTAIATDADGNVYVAGSTWSSDFRMNGWRTSPAGGGDAFVVKLSPAGAQVWSTYLGGSGGERGQAIAPSGEGTVFVGGVTWSCDYPVYGPAPQPAPGTQCGSYSDGFVTKLTANGMSSVYSTYLGGSSADRVNGLVSSASGSVIVVGDTESADFPVTAGAAQPTLKGGQDAFVTRFAPLATVDYSTYLGGTGGEGASGVARDTAGNAYVTGTTASTDFPTTTGAYDRTYALGNMCSHLSGGPNPYWVEEECPEAFITKLKPDGTGLVYSTYVGTDRVEESYGIAVDAAGNAYITGRTNATALPKVGTQVGPGGGWLDSFAFVLSADGSRPIHSTLLGGTDGDFGEDVAVMPDGTAWYAGWTWSLDFPVTADAGQKGRDGGEDGFATRFAPQAPQGHDDPIITFDHRGGNEWWVEVSTGGLGAKPTQVQAKDANSPWTALTLRSWGNWAGSFHIEPGNQVLFRGLVGGEWFDSCSFTHPAGKTPTGGESCAGVRESAPPPGFDATFTNVKGNEWWVQANVAANQPLAGVDARVGCGPTWTPLTLQDWGGWAASFHVTAGSKVDLRARSTGGAQDVSGGYVWPQATPTAPC
ncbi:MAG: hypothetical protein QOJ26_1620 [Thermoplasmata archaeon]|nr:hypothetical protein [Thermoplasmata archaeon]